jgi:hypothetical protein
MKNGIFFNKTSRKDTKIAMQNWGFGSDFIENLQLGGHHDSRKNH